MSGAGGTLGELMPVCESGANLMRRTGPMRRTFPTRRTGPTRCKLRRTKEN